jgi:Fe-S cluster assembly iron-binding protein IscA
MLTVTKRAAAVLKAAKAAKGAHAVPESGFEEAQWPRCLANLRFPSGSQSGDEPASDDEESKQHELRIFVEDALVEPLDGQTLDVREVAEGMELVFV